MTGDRFDPDENPVPPTPCRLFIAPREPEIVPVSEMDAWLEEYERRTQTGKHRPKKPPPEPLPVATRDRGEGRFGTEAEE